MLSKLKKVLLIYAVTIIGFVCYFLLMRVFYQVCSVLKMSSQNEVLFVNGFGFMVSAYIAIVIALELSERWGLLPKGNQENKIKEAKIKMEPHQRIRKISHIAMVYSGLYFIAIAICMIWFPLYILRTPFRKLAYIFIPLLCFIFSFLMRKGKYYANYALGGLLIAVSVFSLFYDYPQESGEKWPHSSAVFNVFSCIIPMLFGFFFILIKKIIKPSK